MESVTDCDGNHDEDDDDEDDNALVHSSVHPEINGRFCCFLKNIKRNSI